MAGEQRYALESGVTTINGKVARPGTIIRNGDRLEYVLYLTLRGSVRSQYIFPCYRNIVHRHEPPVTSTPVQILHTDYEREFIVINKPGSIVRSSIQPLPVSTLIQYVHTSLCTPPEDSSIFPSLKYCSESLGSKRFIVSL